MKPLRPLIVLAAVALAALARPASTARADVVINSDTYAAIAYSPSTGDVGYAWDCGSRARAERLALAHVVDVGEFRRELHFLQQLVLARCIECRFEFDVAVEVILDGALRPTGHDAHVGQTCADCFFDDVLDRRLVDDRQHFLRCALRRR